MGRWMVAAYRRDLANIGLDGYARQLWGSASFSMAAWVAGAWRCGEDERIDLGRLWRLRW